MSAADAPAAGTSARAAVAASVSAVFPQSRVGKALSPSMDGAAVLAAPTPTHRPRSPAPKRIWTHGRARHGPVLEERGISSYAPVRRPTREGRSAMTAPDEDPRLEALLRAAPTREVEPLTSRDRVVEGGVALSLAAVVASLALGCAGPDTSSVWLAVILGVLHIVTRRVRFSIGSGTASPVLLAVVPMLVLLHPALALAAIAVSGTLARSDDYVRGRVHPDHMVLG